MQLDASIGPTGLSRLQAELVVVDIGVSEVSEETL